MSSQDDFGCLDGACPFHSRFGMHTNGGCNCVYDAFPDIEQRRLVDRMLRRARDVAVEDGKKLGMRDAPAVAKAVQGFLGAVLDLPKREARRVVESELRRLEDVRDAEARSIAERHRCPKCFADTDTSRGPAGWAFVCGSLNQAALRPGRSFIQSDDCKFAEEAFWRGAATQPDGRILLLGKRVLEVFAQYARHQATAEVCAAIGQKVVEVFQAWDRGDHV